MYDLHGQCYQYNYPSLWTPGILDIQVLIKTIIINQWLSQAFCTECVSRISICALDRQIIKDVITVYK